MTHVHEPGWGLVLYVFWSEILMIECLKKHSVKIFDVFTTTNLE